MFLFVLSWPIIYSHHKLSLILIKKYTIWRIQYGDDNWIKLKSLQFQRVVTFKLFHTGQGL